LILVDTSAWVEYLRGTGSPAHARVRDLVAEGGPIATTDVVVMEVLAGAGSEQRARTLRRLLLGCEHLPVEGLADFEAAAELHRRCRRGGATVRALTDCLIAAVAIRADVPVLHVDRDFSHLARHTELRELSPPG